jgi:hypothetical protein
MVACLVVEVEEKDMIASVKFVKLETDYSMFTTSRFRIMRELEDFWSLLQGERKRRK